MAAVTRVVRPVRNDRSRRRRPPRGRRQAAASSTRRSSARSSPSVILRLKYRNVVFNLVSDITIGAGALIVGGGMVFVIFSMSFFTGTEVGLQGFKGLEQIGAETFTGLIGSFANTREVTPLIAGVAFAAQVGAGFTAELGAMRISEEIDALEVMSVPSMAYLVATRVVAALHRHHPALPDLAVRQLLRHQARDDAVLRPVAGRLRLLLPPLPAVDRHRLQPHQGVRLRRRRGADPLLLRLLRHAAGRPAWAWPWAGPSACRS